MVKFQKLLKRVKADALFLQDGWVRGSRQVLGIFRTYAGLSVYRKASKILDTA